MKDLTNPSTSPSATQLTTRIVTEKLARQRFNDVLDTEHALGARHPKGRSLYQVVCRGDEWVGLVLWTGALWHLKARDLHLSWDPLVRSERLQLIVHQARFLVPEKTREPNLASACLAASTRDLPAQWEECFGYRPLLAESFTDPDSHAGTCYKASGWEAVGFSGRDGRHYAEKLPEPLGAKKLWIKTLHPQAKTLLCADALPEVYRPGLAAHVAARSALKAPQLSSLFEALHKVPDPRSRCARAFPIGAVLTLITLGLLRGAVHLSTIARSAQKLSQDQRRRLRLPYKKGTRFVRVPGYSVFREILRRVDLDELARVLTLWMQAHAGELPRTLAIDGKTIRDHLGLIVTLVDTEEGTPVAVLANPKGKGHELKTVQKLLAAPAVNLTHAVITSDSLHCQDQTAHIITREKGADYVTQVRDNQPTLHAYAQAQLADAPPLLSSPESGHGRIDLRELSAVVTDAAACDFPEARRLIRARTQTHFKPAAEPPGAPTAQSPAPGTKSPDETQQAEAAAGAGRKPKAKPGKEDEELVRHFVSSLGEAEASRKRLAGIIRSHWSCETRHWERDTQWREDACLLRDPNAACALALLRTGLQALLRRTVKAPLPVIFEDVASHLELGLSWLKKRNFRL